MATEQDIQRINSVQVENATETTNRVECKDMGNRKREGREYIRIPLRERSCDMEASDGGSKRSRVRAVHHPEAPRTMEDFMPLILAAGVSCCGQAVEEEETGEGRYKAECRRKRVRSNCDLLFQNRRKMG